jgi:hypothetical protein
MRFKKNLQTSTVTFDEERGGGEVKLGKPSIFMVNSVSPCLSFFLSASIAATYILTTPTSTAISISLELCALNAEFQYFIPRFNKLSLL